MKLRLAIILTISVLALAACNFSLAADVTPPPDYVSPTPAPTLGPLFPGAAPDITNGAAIFAEKCAPCHGTTGMGDGPQSADLPAKVAALGLPATANSASPATWFSVVTQGRINNFMPPFASLTDQERWDVVSYALTLHTTPEQIAAGKNLFEANCNADCAKKFNSLETMSGLSEKDIVAMIKTGDGAFGSKFTDAEAISVAAYIRTLTFAAPQPTPTVAATTEAETPSAETTPVEGTQQAEVTPEASIVAGAGKVSGTIDNKSGDALPADLKITLHGLEHGADASTGPQETVKLEGTVNVDGSYVFENVDLPENRIYLTELELNGIQYQSEFVIVKAGMTEIAIAPIVIHPTTEDYSILKVNSLQYYFDYATEGSVQIFAVYSITNPSDKTVIVKVNAARDIPFIKMPEGVTSMGYQTTQDSAIFLPMKDDVGFAMPPTNGSPYGLIALGTIPKDKKFEIGQSVLLPVDKVELHIPLGVTVEGKNLTDKGLQNENGGQFTIYELPGMNTGEKVTFTLSGKATNTAVNPDVTQNQNLLIAIGILGIALIIAGAWLYLRQRKNDNNTTADDEDEETDTDSILDAIVAIDDLHREGKISDEAYQKRRAELKNSLKKG